MFEVLRIDADYISTLQIKNRTLKKMMELVNIRYKLEELVERRSDELMILGSFE